MWSSWWNEKPAPRATLSTINPTWPHLRSNPGHCSGKSATNDLSYDKANTNLESVKLVIHSPVHYQSAGSSTWHTHPARLLTVSRNSSSTHWPQIATCRGNASWRCAQHANKGRSPAYHRTSMSVEMRHNKILKHFRIDTTDKMSTHFFFSKLGSPLIKC
jgi:hypothetical protein